MSKEIIMAETTVISDHFLRIMTGQDGEGDGRGGDGGGGNRERGRGPEGPRGPEGGMRPEWLTNPERGRGLVEKIAYMETQLPYGVRWNEENGPILYALCDELIKFVDGIEENRYFRSSFSFENAHSEVNPESGESFIEAICRSYRERAERIAQQVSRETQAAPEDFINVESLDTLVQKYNSLATPIAEIPQIEEHLLKYFREAKRKGLLKGVDDTLNAIYLRYLGRGISAADARELLHQATEISATNNRPSGYITAESAFRGKMGDLEVNPRLFNVWRPYLQWAGARIESLLDGLPQVAYREGEWHFPVEQTHTAIKETHWRPYAGYPDYYEVSARTPDEFMVAKETFLQMLRNHALGYDPNELMTNLINFKKVMSRNATELAMQQESWPDGPDKMTTEFAEELRQEFESEAFLWFIDYNIEHYNKDGAKQGEMAMAMHEGPKRWTRALRARNGIVGSYEYALDNDPLVEFAYNTQGSRGQLGHRSDVQNYMRKKIEEMMIERGMGVILKDYDSRDIDVQSKSDLRYNRVLLLEGIEALLKRNNNNLDVLSDEDRELYIQTRKQLRENQERIGIHQSDEALRSLYEGMDKGEEGFIRGDAHLRNFWMYRNLDEGQLPSNLRKSVALGGIQFAILNIRGQVKRGEVILKRNEELIDKLVDLRGISKQDREFYKQEYNKSKAAYEVAMQMQSATREKAIRGGGVFLIYKNPYVREYQKVREADDQKLSFQERKSRWDINQHRGWILDSIAKGKRVETFDEEEWRMYRDLPEKDKLNIVDNIPVHLAVKAVQATVNWIKIMYRDDSEIWDRADLKRFVQAKDEKGNFRYPNFRAVFRNAMVEETRNMAIDQIAADGYEAKFYYTNFMVTGFDVKNKRVTTRASGEAKPMMFRKPKGEEGKEIDPQTGKMIVTGTKEEHLDFDKAPNSYLALHTTDTYNAYQNNKMHVMVPAIVFEQARQIRDGKLRPEDADIRAGLLLTLDPGLCRVKSFPGEQMGIEYIVFDAAVEESYMDWVEIKKGLNEEFLSIDGNPEYMKMGYYTEDWGGDSRFSLMIENLIAKMPKRFDRRFAAALSITPMYASSMADNLGRKGVMGAVSMMDDKIKDISGQELLSQFGITKFINLMSNSLQLYFLLVGGTDPKTGLPHEGLLMKPTNNADKLTQLRDKFPFLSQLPNSENEGFYALLESFGRVWDVLKQIRTMYSEDRNAQGALDLRKTDVFLPDGRYNPAINTDRNTGSSRHIAKMFWDGYVDWVLDSGPGGGQEAYKEVAYVYLILKQPFFEERIVQRGEHFISMDGREMISEESQKIMVRDGRTWADWLFDKMAL